MWHNKANQVNRTIISNGMNKKLTTLQGTTLVIIIGLSFFLSFATPLLIPHAQAANDFQLLEPDALAGETWTWDVLGMGYYFKKIFALGLTFKSENDSAGKYTISFLFRLFARASDPTNK